MSTDRRLRLLTKSLFPLGAIVSTLGIAIGGLAEIVLGVATLGFGGLSYAFVRRTPAGELDSTKPTGASSLVRTSGALLVFLVSAYVTTVVGIADPAAITTAPESMTLSIATAALGVAFGAGVPFLIGRDNRPRAAEIVWNVFTFGTFVGLLAAAPSTGPSYAAAFLVARVGAYGYGVARRR